jgi:hypothetical protein
MVNMTLTEKLAREFSSKLRRHLSDKEMEEVNRLNATEGYADQNLCASQNYLDANITMSEAFHIVTGYEVDVNDEKDVRLWNDAWKMAQEHKFYESEMPKIK